MPPTALSERPPLPPPRLRPLADPDGDTALHASGPPTLDRRQLREAQRAILDEPHRRTHALLRVMFAVMDLLFGRRPSLQKFLVLEHLAQVPYRSWERVAQRRLARTHGRSTLAARIQVRVAEARAQHDNEQWHMLVLEDLVVRTGRPLGRWRHRRLPRLMALPWQLFTWLLHLVRPDWSYALNASFEAHAEREYMRYVEAHPELDLHLFDGPLAARFGGPVTVADVLRQIGHDEHSHRIDSEHRAVLAASERTDPPVAP